MWSKYKCQELDIEKNDDKYIKLISSILNNPIVNTTIKIILTMLGTVAGVAGTGGSVVLELFKIFKPKKVREANAPWFDFFISIMKLTEISTLTILNVNKTIVEKNPKSSFIDSLIKIKFTGNFEDFEKECDVIFAKETYDYTAEELTILYLTMISVLDEYSKKNTVAGILDLDLMQGINEEMTKSSLEDKFKYDAKTGNFGLDYSDDTIKDKIKELKKTWFKVKESTTTIYRMIDDGNFNSNLGRDTLNEFANYINYTIGLGPSVITDEKKYLATYLEIGSMYYKYNYNKNKKNHNDFLIAVDNIIPMLEKQYNIILDVNQFTLNTERYFRNDVYRVFDTKYPLFMTLAKDFTLPEYIEYGKETLLVDIAKSSDKSVKELHSVQNMRFTEIGVFLLISKQYDMIKFLMTHLLPTRLSTLIFDSDSKFYMSEEILSIIAGVLLGPEYLAENTEGSTQEIVKDYMDIETAQVDPFITKYMQDQKFVKEKKPEENEFNIFISNANIADIQRAQKEGITSKIVIGGALKSDQEKIDSLLGEPKKNKIDEKNVNVKLEYLIASDKIAKTAKLLKVAEDQDLLDEIMSEVKKHEDQVDKSTDAAIVAGLLSGNILNNNLKKSSKDRIHRILCYLSSNLRSLTNLQCQIRNIILAFFYLSSKINGKVYENYKTWAKGSTDKSLTAFGNSIRRSKQSNIVTAFLS